MRGRKPLSKLIPILLLAGLFLWKHRIVIGLGSLSYMLYGLGLFLYPHAATSSPTVPTPSTDPPATPRLQPPAST